ncbi:MAG: adenylyltransferase/cytidyltransferase family protein [Planctomycetota bacterium]
MSRRISTPLDGLTGPNVRAVEGAGGSVTVELWSDALVEKLTGAAPKFPLVERRYMAEALRWVDAIEVVDDADRAATPNGNYPDPPTCPLSPPGKKVLVTGCFDLMHSGHVRFFEEASAFGDLYVIVGHDANIRLLKGDDRPLIDQRERAYLCNAIRHVTLAVVSTGEGWLDAAPEIERLQPDIYLVNEDGDHPQKRDFCRTHGLEYVVLPRTPPPGLTPRSSTQLRARRPRS